MGVHEQERCNKKKGTLMIAELLPDLVVSISMDVRGAARPSDHTVHDFGGSHLGLCAVAVRWVMSLLGKTASRHGGHGRLPCTRAQQARDSWLERAQSARARVSKRALRESNSALPVLKARAQAHFCYNRPRCLYVSGRMSTAFVRTRLLLAYRP